MLLTHLSRNLANHDPHGIGEAKSLKILVAISISGSTAKRQFASRSVTLTAFQFETLRKSSSADGRRGRESPQDHDSH